MLNYLEKIKLKNKINIDIAYINRDNNLTVLNLLSSNIALQECNEFMYSEDKAKQLDIIITNLKTNLEKLK